MGFQGVLFSGGGENLEDEAFTVFLELLKYAKREVNLETNLATNGLRLNSERSSELCKYLDSIRFSVPPIKENYCHAGLIAPLVRQFKNATDAYKRVEQDYVFTKIYINLLMSPRHADGGIRSQHSDFRSTRC